MEEIGLIKTTSNNRAEIEIDPSNMCGYCSNKSACQLDEGGKKRTLIARNDINAKKGDFVQVELAAKHAIFSAFLVFIFPLISLVVGYAWGNSYSQGWGIVLALAFLVVSFYIVRKVDRWMENRKEFQPEIVKIFDHRPIPESKEILEEQK